MATKTTKKTPAKTPKVKATKIASIPDPKVKVVSAKTGEQTVRTMEELTTGKYRTDLTVCTCGHPRAKHQDENSTSYRCRADECKCQQYKDAGTYGAKPNTPIGQILTIGKEKHPESLAAMMDLLPPGLKGDLNEAEVMLIIRNLNDHLVTTIPSLALIQELEDNPKSSQIESLRKEVKRMATKTAQKAKPKGAAKAAAKAERVERDCHCGCGGKTFGNFAPGHDARVYSILKKEANGETVKLPKAMMADKDLLETMRAKVH